MIAILNPRLLEIMDGTKYSVESDYNVHTEKFRLSLQAMRNDPETTDITLICNDFKVLKGHKIVLNAFSPVLSKIIRNIPGPSSVLYLKGINSNDMDSILDFMYDGKVTIDKTMVPSFFELGKHLDIELLSQFEGNIKDSDKEDEGEIKNSHLKKFTPRITCPECDTHFNFEESLRRHFLIYHEQSSTETAFKAAEEGKYPCQECDKTFGYTSHLRRHTKTVHEGQRFRCDYCGHTASQRVHLRIHIKNKHASKHQRQEKENELIKFEKDCLEV